MIILMDTRLQFCRKPT